MATLPKLVDALVVVDGRERATIEYTARVVREAGFMPTLKRGGGAAEMDSLAAANLLIALNAADAPKNAATAVSVVRFLERSGGADDERIPDPLRAIGSSKTFGEALKIAIEEAPAIFEVMKQLVDRAFAPDERESQYRQILLNMSPVKFEVEIAQTFARFSLVADGFDFPVQWEERFYFNLTGVKDRVARDYVAKLWSADRKVWSRFGIVTLLHISAALAGAASPIEGVEGESA